MSKKFTVLLCILALALTLSGVFAQNVRVNAYEQADVLSTSLTTVTEEGEKAIDPAWDATALGDTSVEYANGVSENYLYLTGEPMQMQFATPITQHKDVVLEFDYMAESNANSYMGYMQFGPFAGRNSANMSEGTWPMFNYLSQQVIDSTISGGAYVMKIQDLREGADAPVQDTATFNYGFVPGNRIRMTFEVESGDAYIAQKPIGSDAEFTDDVRIVGFMQGPTDHQISESAPCYFMWCTYRQLMLGDVVLRYRDGEIIHDVNFDTDLRLHWGNFLNGYHMINVDRPTWQVVSPIFDGMNTGERLVLKEEIVKTEAWASTKKTVFEVNTAIRMIDMTAADQSFGFLFGMQNADDAWNAEGVVYVKFWRDANFTGYMDVLRGGVPVYTNPVPLDNLLRNNYALRIVGYSDGQVEIYINGVIRGGYSAGDMYGKMAIVSEGEGESRFGFGSDFTVTRYADVVYEGADQAINFNALQGSEEPAYVDEAKWYMNSTSAAFFADEEAAKGLHVAEDGTLFFEGTTDGSMFAPKGQYGNFILEFDFYNFAAADKPAQRTDEWTHGYSSLGVSFGKSSYDANWASAKILMFDTETLVFQALNDSPVTTGSAPISTAGKWNRFKIVAQNNTVTVYACELTEGKEDYTSEDYVQVGQFTCQNQAGYVSFGSTEGGYFKVDKIRITNIDEGTDGYVDFAPIADDYGPANVTAVSGNEAYGTVTGGGACSLGDSVTVTAAAQPHYVFVEWQDASGATVSEEASYTFTVLSREVSLKAVFEAVSYNVTVAANDDTMGTVSGATSAVFGTEVTVSATANKYHSFVAWKDAEGTTVSESAEYTFSVAGNTSLTAEFARDSYTVTATANDAAYGTVSGAATVQGGDSVTLTATANSGYTFVRWEDASGNSLSTSAEYTFVPESDVMVIAVFSETPVTITVTVSDEAHGTVTGGGTYAEGASVTLTATAKSGYKFVRWEDADGTSVSTDAEYTFTASADATYKAVFEVKNVTITATVSDEAHGTVTGGGTYAEGASVTLTATAKSGYKFVRWEDADGTSVSTDAEYTFTASADATYKAVFEAEETDSDPADPGTDDKDEPAETGCGSAVAGGYLALGAICVLAACVLFRKR